MTEVTEMTDETPEQEPAIRTRQAMRALWRSWLLVAAGLILAILPGLFLGWLAEWTGPKAARYATQFWSEQSISGTQAMAYAGLALAAFGLGHVAYEWLVERYRVEGDVVARSRGIIARSVDQLVLQDIRTVSMDQSLIARMIGYGTLRFASAGTAEDDVTFHRIKNPMQLKQELTQRQRERS
jgi:hypothetical protein